MASAPTDFSIASDLPDYQTDSVGSDDETRRHSKPPSPLRRESRYKSIDLKANKALIMWTGDDGLSGSLGRCNEGKRFIAIHFAIDMDAHTGLFRILIPFTVAAREKLVKLYIFFAPESIRSVSSDEPESSGLAQKELQTQTHCLRFTLSRSGSLVVPNSLDLASLHGLSDFASVCALATQTEFSVHIPTRTCSKSELRVLCDEVSSPTAGYRSDPRGSNINSLYAGEGGQILEENPPEYDNPAGFILAQGPVAEPEPGLDQAYSKKRRRQCSSSCSSQEWQSNKALLMLERLTQSVDTLSAQVSQMSSRLDRLESQMETMAENLQSDFERSLQDNRDETQNTIDATYEDLLWTAQDNLKDNVNEQMAEVEERVSRRVLRSLRNGAMTMQLELLSDGDST